MLPPNLEADGQRWPSGFLMIPMVRTPKFEIFFAAGKTMTARRAQTQLESGTN